MVHSVSGWTWGVQVKLWDPLRTRAIPERLRSVFTTRRYTNPRLPLPLPSVRITLSAAINVWMCGCSFVVVSGRVEKKHYTLFSSFCTCYGSWKNLMKFVRSVEKKTARE